MTDITAVPSGFENRGLNLLDMKLRTQPGCLLDTDETQGFIALLPLPNGRQQLMLWGVDDGWGFVTQAIGRRCRRAYTLGPALLTWGWLCAQTQSWRAADSDFSKAARPGRLVVAGHRHYPFAAAPGS